MQYCDRALLVSPYYYCLILNEKDYIAELKRLEVPVSDAGKWLGQDARATTHVFDHKSGKRVCVVCLNDDKKIDAVSKVSTIVHEAVHIWQFICEYIGEDKPSPEFEAYSIQSITHELLLAYDRAKSKKKKKRA